MYKQKMLMMAWRCNEKKATFALAYGNCMRSAVMRLRYTSAYAADSAARSFRKKLLTGIKKPGLETLAVGMNACVPRSNQASP